MVEVVIACTLPVGALDGLLGLMCMQGMQVACFHQLNQTT